MAWFLLAACDQPKAGAPKGEDWKALKEEVIRLAQSGDYDRAVKVGVQAVAVAKSETGYSSLATAECLSNLGLLYASHSRFDEAGPLFKEALAILEVKAGPKDPKVADTLHNLALVYRQQGRIPQAEAMEAQASAILGIKR